jgi:alkylresorcinol/alkylpyrone synthase
MVELLRIATSVPPHCIEVSETKSYLERYLTPAAARRFTRMAEGTRIRRRYAAVAVDELLQLTTIQTRNEVYIPHALSLGEAVARDALAVSQTSPDAVTAVFSVSCTGYMMPALEAHLCNSLGLSSSIRRIPITELGCSAGVAAVGLASDLLTSSSQQNALIVSVEVCSPGVQTIEPSTTDVLANMLFGDAAAATMLTTEATGRGPEVLDSQSRLWPETLDHLGMRMTDSGLRLVLSPELPRVVRARLGVTVDEFLARHALTRTDLSFWAIHPGGPRILEATAEALELADRAVQPTWEIWERYGNLSSSTVFFILQHIQQSVPPSPGDVGMLLALGPGISCEMVLLRAAGWLSQPD